MVREPSIRMMAAALRMGLVRALLLGNLARGLLPLAMPSVLALVLQHMEEVTAGAPAPRHLHGEHQPRLLELVETIHGDTPPGLRALLMHTMLQHLVVASSEPLPQAR